MLYLFTMTREEIHNEIDNTLKLIEINNNRMYLNDSDFDLDLALMRNQVIRLYQLHDQLQLSQSDEVITVPTVTSTQTEPIQPVATKEAIQPKQELIEPEAESTPEPELIEIKEEAKPISKPKVAFKPEVVEPKVEETPTPPKEEPRPEVVVEKTPEPVVKAQEPKKEAPKAVKPAPKVADTGSKDVYAKLKNTKLESIKKGISISKRYEVQNELFGNDPQVYNEAIQTLDSQNNLEEAMDYFDNTLMVYHQWEEDNALVEEIRELLLRRYM